MGKKGKRAAKAGGGQPKEGTGAARRAKAAAIREIEEGIDRLIEKLEVELKEKDLFEPAVAKEECPICFLPFAYFEYKDTYMSCCGKYICNGCAFKEALLQNKNSRGKLILRCAFCRKETGIDTDEFDQTKKRADLGDTAAICHLADIYIGGLMGKQKDELAAFPLLLSAANEGSSNALISLASACYDGHTITKNMDTGIVLASFAAKMGNPVAHECLGEYFGRKAKDISQDVLDVAELERKSLMDSATAQASQHCGFAAKYGSKRSLAILNLFTEMGYFSPQAYEHLERSCERANEHVVSEERELAERAKKGVGTGMT